MHVAIYAGLFLCFFVAGPSAAQPTYGRLTGKLDLDPMQYNCNPADATGRITCEFVQVLLSKAETAEDWERTVAQIDEILEQPNELMGLCRDDAKAFKDAVSRFDQGLPLEDGKAPPTDPRDLDDLRTFARLIASFCVDRTAENLKAMLWSFHEKAARTCKPMINQFSQTFVQVSETMWVAESSPTGPCGLIQASRFTLPENGFGSLWEYTAQKMVTNKTGENLGLACSDLNEEPILYTWNTSNLRSTRIGCEFIE